MNRRVMNILFLAFLIAAASSFLIYRLLGRRIGGGAPVPTSQVVVAARDVQLGNILKDGDVKLASISGTPPKGSILKVQDAIGRGVVSDVYEGEPVLEPRLAPPGSGGGLAATIPPGMRACAVRVDEVVGVAGFVTPGMHVDVLISGTPPGQQDSAQGPEVKTLLQNIGVLSAGTDIQHDAEGKAHPVQVVNLLVTPEQAEQLSLAGNQTRIQLVLRNPLDTEIATTPTTATASLFNDRPAAPKVVHSGGHAAPPRVLLVQVFNGSKRSEEKFAASEEK